MTKSVRQSAVKIWFCFLLHFFLSQFLFLIVVLCAGLTQTNSFVVIVVLNTRMT